MMEQIYDIIFQSNIWRTSQAWDCRFLQENDAEWKKNLLYLEVA